LDGVAHDFNLIARRDGGRSTLTVHRLAEREGLSCNGGGLSVLHVLRGGLETADGAQLGMGDTRIAEPGSPPDYRASSRALVLVATLT
jgi:hypothetical protein